MQLPLYRGWGTIFGWLHKLPQMPCGHAKRAKPLAEGDESFKQQLIQGRPEKRIRFEVESI